MFSVVSDVSSFFWANFKSQWSAHPMKPTSNAANNQVVKAIVISICIMLNDLTDPTPIRSAIYMRSPIENWGGGVLGVFFRVRDICA
jgi:hypothetical protein